jgi:small subunit ribosomal protein S2
MKPYIFGARNGIYIIDLQKTAELFKQAYQAVVQAVGNGGKVLFVGTKKQAAEIIAEDAKRCGMWFVNSRWLGGTMTNFVTVKRTIERLKALQEMREKGIWGGVTKKEQMGLQKELVRLEKTLGGLRDMDALPAVIFVIDPRKEHIAVHEANKLEIPVVAMCDTNCDPEPIDYLIPSNDDAIRAIKLFTGAIADAVVEGKVVFEENVRQRRRADEAARPPRPAPAPKPESAPGEEKAAAPPSGVAIELKRGRKHPPKRKGAPEERGEAEVDEAVDTAPEFAEE